MATLTPTPPVKAKPNPPRRPTPPDDLIPSGPTGGVTYPSDAEAPYVPPAAKRRSVWPFLTDFGLVMALFGLIIGNALTQITGQVLIVVGLVIFVTALLGWIREARSEFSKLAE